MHAIPGGTASAFASKDNLSFAKQHQVRDVVFAKHRGLGMLDMAQSNWVYKCLKLSRAGIEAHLSALKRRFGLTRCTWSRGFRRYGAMSGAMSLRTTCWCWHAPSWPKVNETKRL